MTRKKANDYLEAISSAKHFLHNHTNQNAFRYSDYFEFSSLFTLINCLARESDLDKDERKLWRETATKIHHLYKTALFPSFSAKIKWTPAVLSVSSVRLYSMLYRLIKR